MSHKIQVTVPKYSTSEVQKTFAAKGNSNLLHCTTTKENYFLIIKSSVFQSAAM